jgi:hypothetical protein
MVHRSASCRIIQLERDFAWISHKGSIFFHVGSFVVANVKECSLGERCTELLPGQYLDKETNLHYNYYRDCDPFNSAAAAARRSRLGWSTPSFGV